MENNDSNTKPQQTGGLKLMTVFIAVLALHVVVIGGLTAYHLMSGGSSDADLVTDKSHKGVKVSPDGTVSIDSQATDPDASQADKSATASTTTPPADTTSASAPAPTTVTETSNPAATPAVNSPAPAPVAESTAPVQSGPVITPADAPAPAPATAMTTAPVTTPIAQSDSLIGTPYVVKPGDTLAKIAHRNHTSMAKLKSANGLNGDVLHLGQKLLIPSKTVIAAVSNAAPTEDAVGTTTVLDNSPSEPAITPRTVAKTSMTTTSGRHTYTVVKGDTLSRIAHKFKTTATALMTANNISDPTKLSIGKKLVIPSRESRSATTATPANPQPSQAKAGPAGQLANFVQ